MDDIDSKCNQSDIDSQILNFIANDTTQLEKADQIARDYWAPLGDALRFEREYAISDENWLYPNDDCLNTPL